MKTITSLSKTGSTLGFLIKEIHLDLRRGTDSLRKLNKTWTTWQ